jgi:succinate-semialdehyde dehydrogenase/glutarate-semialdehyde dehydrogenase
MHRRVFPTDALPLRDEYLLRQKAYVNGAWCDADDGGTLTVTNPATGQPIGTVPRMGAPEARRAIDAARAAWPAWRRRTARERATVLRRWSELILGNQEDLAVIVTAEHGKPLPESRGEVASAASRLEWFAEEGRRVHGDPVPAPAGDRRIVVTKEPVGVVAAITPWCFPSAMVTRKAGPALAAGCPVVLKPASATPFSALALAELGERAGVPAGIFSVVTGAAGAIGGELTTNPLVRKVTFTGSAETGKQLMAQGASTVKRLSLELGGSAPFIVFDDADLDAAVEGAIASKYRNTGQTCVCASRLLVQDGIHDVFVAKLAAAVGRLHVGNGLRPDVQQGPLIDLAAVQELEAHVADAVAKGGRVLVGGKRHVLGGNFFEPTVISGATPEMAVAREETSGPLAPVFRFRTEAEALALANDTGSALAAFFYTRDLGRAWRVGEALEAGMVGLNTGLVSTEAAPLDGVKQSGTGREGSREGIDDYLVTKYLCVAGIV